MASVDWKYRKFDTAVQDLNFGLLNQTVMKFHIRQRHRSKIRSPPELMDHIGVVSVPV